MNPFAQIAVTDPSGVGAAKRRARAVTRGLEFDDVVRGNLDVIVTELASNMVKHAPGGTILLDTTPRRGVPGVDVLALDRGPGMKDLAGSMRDGYSTAGSLGTGLGAVRRLSSSFDAYAPVGSGTAVFCRVSGGHPGAFPLLRLPLTVGAVRVPAPGEERCGDTWAAREDADEALVMVADGLGHGPQAADAAEAAAAMVLAGRSRDPAAHVAAVDGALRGTRGAAVAVADIVPAAGRTRLAGLGNISVRLGARGSLHGLATKAGTAGMGLHTARTSVHDWPADGMLVMHSDGLTSHWDLDDYPGLWRRHPTLVAGVLARDFTRGRDDVCVLVATSLSEAWQ